MSAGWQIHEHDSVTSTQDILKDMAKTGAAEGSAILAAEQTGGRGRHGRAWVSEPGNLYLSLLLRPNCKAEKLGQISMMAGLAVYQAIAEVIDHPQGLMLKWPNDVLLGDKKCAGILIETSLKGDGVEWVSIGIGVNITSAPEMGICLNDHAAAEIAPTFLRDFLLSYMGLYYVQWKRDGAFHHIRSSWLGAAHKKGVPLTVKINKREERGAFHDIDKLGNLLLQTPDGEIKTITAGDVYL